MQSSDFWLHLTVFLSLILTIQQTLGANTPQEGVGEQNRWLKRKEVFYNITKFDLSQDNVRLFGGKWSNFKSTHLPFWFDFELFKAVFNKTYATEEEELKRHNSYIKTCIRTLKARVLYRILAGTHDTLIKKDADRLYSDKISPGDREAGIVSDENGIKMRVEIEFENELEPVETPIQKAIRLVREELDKVESRNQLNNYLKAFEEIDGPAMDGKLPY